MEKDRFWKAFMVPDLNMRVEDVAAATNEMWQRQAEVYEMACRRLVDADARRKRKDLQRLKNSIAASTSTSSSFPLLFTSSELLEHAVLNELNGTLDASFFACSEFCLAHHSLRAQKINRKPILLQEANKNTVYGIFLSLQSYAQIL